MKHFLKGSYGRKFCQNRAKNLDISPFFSTLVRQLKRTLHAKVFLHGQVLKIPGKDGLWFHYSQAYSDDHQYIDIQKEILAYS